MLKKIKILSVIIIILAIAFIIFGTFGDFSKGKRVGFITKFSNKGYLFKTFEGEINSSLVPASGIGGVDNLRYFSVLSSDTAAINQIERAMRTGKKVEISYKEKIWKLFWRGDTKYFVYKAEVIE